MPRYELNLRDYWQVIQKRRIVAIVVFLAVFIFTVIYTNIQKPVYQSVASVEWVERKALGSLLSELVTVRAGDPLVTQSRIITSYTVLAKVVLELGLAGDHPTTAEIMRRVSGLQTCISARTVEGTNIIHIFVNYSDPQTAAKIANKAAEIYIVENLREKSKQSRAVREFIQGQLEEVNANLKNSEEVLKKFKEEEAPSGIALSLEDRIADLDRERSNLLRQYTLLHPDVRNIEDQIKQLREQLEKVPQKELEYSRLNRDVEINTKLYKELREKLESARIAEAEKVEDVRLIDPALPPERPISPNKGLNYFVGALVGLMLGLSGVFLVEQLDTSVGTIDDVEDYFKLHALGVIPYLQTKDEKEKSITQKLWSKKPRGKEKILRLRNQLLIHYPSSSPTFEAYRILRANIQREIFKGKIKGNIIIFSSAGPEEGKSINVSNLAIAMAQGGLRTLLVDTDMRRSRIHHIFGMKNVPGLSGLLSGTVELKDAVRTFTDILISDTGFDEALEIPGLDNLNILVSGSSSSIPAELLGSKEMETLLGKLREKYDIILMDSPPVLAVADTIILAPKTDGVILIYRVGKTARSILLRAKNQLIESGAQVKGVVLNNISPEMEMRYGYYYHYKYYGKYYTSPKKETEDKTEDKDERKEL